MLKVDIQKVEKVKKYECTSLYISFSKMELGKNVSFDVGTFDEKNILVEKNIVKLEGEDYKKWDNDDNYIVEFVCEKLGYSKLPFKKTDINTQEIQPSIKFRNITHRDKEFMWWSQQ